MSKKTIPFLFVYFLIGNFFAQIDTRVEFANEARQHLDAPRVVKSIDDEELKKTAHIKYLSQGFLKAYDSDSKEISYLRYNIFSDEMEFSRGGKIYALNKKENQIIDFIDLKKKYAIFKLKEKLNYYLLVHSSESSLLIQETVSFDKGKKKVTQFDIAIAPKYVKNKDKIYFAFKNTELKKISKKKKKVYALFGEKRSQLKKYIKKKKLGTKKTTDLIKILKYYNSL